MDRKFVRIAALSLIFLLFTACVPDGSSDKTLEPAPTPTSITAGDSLPLGCQPDRILLDNLKDQLPYSQREIIYQSFAGEHILVVWFSDPELGQGFPAENQLAAAEKAGEAAMRLLDASVCVSKFDLLHLTVVDGEYNQWFSGAVRPGDLSELEETGFGGGPISERGAGVSSGHQQPTDPARSGCDFLSVQVALYEVFEDHGIQAGVSYIGVGGSRDLFLHWALPEGQTPEESLSLLDGLLPAIPCLDPSPVGISITVAGQDGVVLLTGYLPVQDTPGGLSFDIGQLAYEVLESP
jgi:hypothetical protein